MVASLVFPIGGTWPATQACALTGKPTSNPLVCRLALSPLSHTIQGSLCICNIYGTYCCFLQKDYTNLCSYTKCVWEYLFHCQLCQLWLVSLNFCLNFDDLRNKNSIPFWSVVLICGVQLHIDWSYMSSFVNCFWWSSSFY